MRNSRKSPLGSFASCHYSSCFGIGLRFLFAKMISNAQNACQSCEARRPFRISPSYTFAKVELDNAWFA